MIAHALVQWSEDRALEGTGTLSVITNIDWVLGAVVAPLTNLLRDVLPSYAEPWLNIATYYPFLTSIVAIITLWVWNRNSELRDTIQERARLAWNTPRRRASQSHIDEPGRLLRFARWMRKNAGPAQLVITKGLVPAIFLFAIFGSALLLVSNSLFTARSALGKVCAAPVKDPKSPEVAVGTPVLDQPIDANGLFNTSDFCWWSGLAVEKGRKYRVWIEVKEPWFDRTIMTGVNGFQTYELHHYIALPERRLLGADWFQPVVRVGTKGMNDLPLNAVNLMPADELPRRMKPTLPAENDMNRRKQRYPVRLNETDEFKGRLDELGNFAPIPPDMLGEAQQVWKKQGLADHVEAEFVAPDSGELFFYVNDAVQIFPRLLPGWMVPSMLDVIQGPPDLYYKNNSGTAQIKVQRLPSPPMPPGK